MADAKKCDICGKYYDHYNTARDPENPNALIFISRDDDGFYANDDEDITDCCPDCMESIRAHIESLRQKEEHCHCKVCDPRTCENEECETKKEYYKAALINRRCAYCKHLKLASDSDQCRECQDTDDRPNFEPVSKE